MYSFPAVYSNGSIKFCCFSSGRGFVLAAADVYTDDIFEHGHNICVYVDKKIELDFSTKLW